MKDNSEDENQRTAAAGTTSAENNGGYNGDMTEYCKSLENWLWKAYWQRTCATSAYFTALSLLNPSPFNPSQSASNNADANSNEARNGRAGANAGIRNNNNVGAPNLNIPPQANRFVHQIFVRGVRNNANRTVFDFVVAPLWKRLVAECIDFVILLVVKIFVTFTIIDNFDLIDLDSIDLDALQESGSIYDLAFSLTSELILLELTHRVVVCFFEGYCLFKGGATPGKTFVGLRVLYCENVYPILANNRDMYNNNLNNVPLGPGSRILVTPGCFLSFPRAFIRSVMKNFSLAFFFPLCFTLFHFEHSRTLYDIFAKSIVVEVQPLYV